MLSMMNPVNDIRFSKNEQRNLLRLASRINGIANQLQNSKYICNADDLDYLEDIENMSAAIFDVLDKKFKVESTPQKGTYHE